MYLTQCHIPEDFSVEQDLCENFISHYHAFLSTLVLFNDKHILSGMNQRLKNISFLFFVLEWLI
jgi:hypothetical protein